MDNILLELLNGKCELTSLPIFKDKEMLEGRMTKAATVILLVMAIFTVVMNFGVILRIYKLIRRGGNLKPPFYFIGNLAISDFLVGTYIIVVFCIDLSTRSSSTNWRNKCCGFITAIVVTACQETICTITLIAVDKYIFICHGLTYKVKVTTRRVYYCIILSWCYSLFIGILPAIGLHEKNWCSCSFLLYINQGFGIVLFLSAVVIPLAIIITLYSIILSLAVKVTRSRLRDRRKSSTSGVTSIVQLSTSSQNASRPNSRSNSKSSSKSQITHKEKPQNESKSNLKSSIVSRISSKKKDKERRFRNRDLVKPDSEEVQEKKEIIPLHENGNSDTLSVVPESYDRRGRQISISPNGNNEPTYYSESSGTESLDTLPASNSTKKVKKAKTARRSYSLSNADNPEAVDQPEVTLQSYRNFPPDGEVKNPTIRVQKSVQINDICIIRSESLSSNNNNFCSSQDSEGSNNSRQPQWSRKSYYKKIVSETKDKVQFIKKCKAVKIIFMIVGLFIVTYVPFVVGSFVFKVKKEKDEHLFKSLNNLLYCAVVLNSILNPFIYAYGYQEFRIKTKRFKGILAKENKHSISGNP